MKSTIFELHTFSEIDLPIIFHREFSVSTPISKNISNWHENIELILCTGGEGSVFCDMKEYTLKKGQIFIINHDRLHAFGSKSTINYRCLIIDKQFLRENGIDTNMLEFNSEISDETAVNLFENLSDAYVSKGAFRIAEIRLSILSLMVYIANKYSRAAAETGVLQNTSLENIRIALGYIRSHFTEHITLDKLSFETGLSKYHLGREFKRVTKSTVIAYINALRCRLAAELLKEGNMVSIVCYQCGFDNLSYFSKTFKKIMGKLPSKWN